MENQNQLEKEVIALNKKQKLPSAEIEAQMYKGFELVIHPNFKSGTKYKENTSIIRERYCVFFLLIKPSLDNNKSISLKI